MPLAARFRPLLAMMRGHKTGRVVRIKVVVERNTLLGFGDAGFVTGFVALPVSVLISVDLSTLVCRRSAPASV
jgi:hypothetical protein